MTNVERIDELARDDVRNLPRYSTDVGKAVLDLSDNTNLWGSPPAAVRAIQDASSSVLSRYPSLYGADFRAPVLRYLGLDDNPAFSVVTGCGSDDVIDATMRAFGSPGDEVAFSSPTFSMIPVFARLNGLTPIAIPLTESFDVDAERLVNRRAPITYLCAPNNPTATAVSRAAIEYVVTRACGIVLLDEAYAEFAPEIFSDLLASNERLVIARTFSKAFGLAGLRVGFAVAHPRVAEFIERARGPYKVNAMGECAALAALSTEPGGVPWVREHAALTIVNRDRLIGEMRVMGFDPLPSAANFILTPTAHAVSIARRLQSGGIIVRAFTDLPMGIPAFAANEGAALRIGVGPWEAMQLFLESFADIVS